MVEFQGKFDGNVTKSLNNRAFKKFWWLFVLLSLIFVAVGIIGIVCREDSHDLGLGIYFIVMGVIFTPLVFLLTKLLQKKIDKSMSIMSSDTTEIFQFYPDRLIINQRKIRNGEEECEYEATTNTRYSYLHKVEETHDKYFLRISKMQSHVVNKCDLTQGTIEELNSILASNLGLRFKKMK
ncbi:MAG: hypothetical protein K2O41_02775 [Clostridia bacterium]|nr:hypothetical protein [Clostridia bacterium]